MACTEFRPFLVTVVRKALLLKQLIDSSPTDVLYPRLNYKRFILNFRRSISSLNSRTLLPLGELLRPTRS